MIEKAKKYLKEAHIDGWLIYDFQGNNPLGRRALNLKPDQMATRRFFYWIPVKGEPIKLVHAIESHILDPLPGKEKSYSSWKSLEEGLNEILKGVKSVAMEYSANNAIPYVSKVDAGTVDLIRSFGVDVVSSSDFLPLFTATLTESQIGSQLRITKELDTIVARMWRWIGERLGKISEYDVQQKIVEQFQNMGWVYEHEPIVAVNEHSANPHYESKKGSSSLIQKGDFILIDLWAKEKEGIYGDLTRVAVASKTATERQRKIFGIVKEAQISAIDFIHERFQKQMRVEGWEVDEVARKVIRDAGFGNFFIHRLGHNIETVLHGSGAHMDNLEMHDTRPVLPGTCFSIEPGIYLPNEFGVRLECDVVIHHDGRLEISGGVQQDIVSVLMFGD